MDAFTTYKIVINGDSEEIKAIGEFLRDKISDVEFEIGNEMEIIETSEVVFPEEVSDLAIEMAEKFDVSFEMSGLIDTSLSAGEYMAFKFVYKDGTLWEQHSDWYIEDNMDQWESFEEFSDSFEGMYDEATYERFKQSGFMYTLETKEGDILSESVPLVHEYTYDIKK